MEIDEDIELDVPADNHFKWDYVNNLKQEVMNLLLPVPERFKVAMEFDPEGNHVERIHFSQIYCI
jgi:hypothetical protein